MKIFPLLFALTFCLTEISCQQPAPSGETAAAASPGEVDRKVGGACECCEAWEHGQPEKLDWQTTIATADEPGEPLEISGTIFLPDGKTPAEGVILHVYHTDAEGNYSRGPSISTCAKRHGLLRGWMKTGADGKYLFRTIRPASYPGTDISQHIHPIVKVPGETAYWMDEFLFADDPNLTDGERNRKPQRGGNGILQLKKDEEGVWIGRRDVVLVGW